MIEVYEKYLNLCSYLLLAAIGVSILISLELERTFGLLVVALWVGQVRTTLTLEQLKTKLGY